jgi:hypothetical protein
MEAHSEMICYVFNDCEGLVDLMFHVCRLS